MYFYSFTRLPKNADLADIYRVACELFVMKKVQTERMDYLTTIVGLTREAMSVGFYALRDMTEELLVSEMSREISKYIQWRESPAGQRALHDPDYRHPEFD